MITSVHSTTVLTISLLDTIKNLELDVVPHTYNPNTPEVETGGSAMRSRPAWTTQWVTGQLELETPSQKIYIIIIIIKNNLAWGKLAYSQEAKY